MDTLILGLIVLQACLGMVTIIFSLGHLDGGDDDDSSPAGRSRSSSSAAVRRTTCRKCRWIYKLHIFIGLTIILLFPFSRLVHVWSVPFGYVTRRYQLVRRRG